MKKIFFTGGAGLLALNWALYCQKEWDVTLGTFNRKINPSFAKSASLLELQSASALEGFFSRCMPDVVVNSAAITKVEYCELNPSKAYNSNVLFASNVAISCNRLNIPLVHISTDHLFRGSFPNVTEEEEPSPVNVYAKTKADAEIKVASECKNSIIIRTNFFGWGTSYRHSFTDLIISELSNGRPYYAFRDVFFTPILVSDLAQCVFELISKGSRGVFNVSTSNRLSKFDFALSVAKIFGLSQSLVKPISIGSLPNLVARPRDMSLSNKKLSSVLNRGIGNVEDSLYRLLDQANQNHYKEIQHL